LPDPGTQSVTSFTPINHDYGPRNYNTGSNPHVGIDYDIEIGQKGYAVQDGNVVGIAHVGVPSARIETYLKA